MVDWITCPSCSLRHAWRADRLCPRCQRPQPEPTGFGSSHPDETANGPTSHSPSPLLRRLAVLAPKTRIARASCLLVGVVILVLSAQRYAVADLFAAVHQLRLDRGRPSRYVNVADALEQRAQLTRLYRLVFGGGVLLGAGVAACGLLVRRCPVPGGPAVVGVLDMLAPLRWLYRMAARIRSALGARTKPAIKPADWLTRLMIVFTLMLAGSVASGIALRSANQPSAKTLLHLMLGLELADTVIVCVAWLMARRAISWWAPPRFSAWGVWCVAAIALLSALALNWSYHGLLNDYLGIAPLPDVVVATLGYSPVVVLAYCIQPAIVEELFFRWMTFDALQPLVGAHATVTITAVMFGMAHVNVPLSIPLLVLVGILLGYARVVSGGLALPILVHFAHNLMVILWG